MDGYISKYTGKAIEDILDTVKDSGVTSLELARLHEAVVGEVTPSKAVIVNQSKEIQGFNSLGSNKIQFPSISTPSVTSNTQLYSKNGGLYYLTPEGVEIQITGDDSPYQVFPYINKSVVLVEHGLQTLYPNVILVESEGSEFSGVVRYIDINNLRVTLNTPTDFYVVVSL